MRKKNMWYFAQFDKNKNTRGAVLLSLKFEALALIVTLFHECFSRFLHCENATIHAKPLILPKMVFMQKWLFKQPKLKEFLEHI